MPASSATRAALGDRSPCAISSIIASTMRRWLDRPRSRRPSTRDGAISCALDFLNPVAIAPLLARLRAGVKHSCVSAHILTHIVPIVFQYARSEEHTSELQSLLRTSYAFFCLTKKNNHDTPPNM